MKTNKALLTDGEAKELKYVGVKRIRLQYLKNSKKKMGLALWNLMEPQLKNYPPNGGQNGYPTFSIDGLRKEGLI